MQSNIILQDVSPVLHWTTQGGSVFHSYTTTLVKKNFMQKIIDLFSSRFRPLFLDCDFLFIHIFWNDFLLRQHFSREHYKTWLLRIVHWTFWLLYFEHLLIYQCFRMGRKPNLNRIFQVRSGYIGSILYTFLNDNFQWRPTFWILYLLSQCIARELEWIWALHCIHHDWIS